MTHAHWPLIVLLGALASSVACDSSKKTPKKPTPAKVDVSHSVCEQTVNKRCVGDVEAFEAHVPNIQTVVRATAPQKSAGDFEIIWIAEAVRGVSKDHRIRASKGTLDKALLATKPAFVTYRGGLTRPTKGWPSGKYRVEVHVNGKLLSAKRFEIRPPKAAPLGLQLCTVRSGEGCAEAKLAFAQHTPLIHAVLKTETLPKTTGKFTVAWIAEDVGKATPKGHQIAKSEGVIPNFKAANGKTVTIAGQLSRPKKGWPVGKYKVLFDLEGKQIGAQSFKVGGYRVKMPAKVKTP